MLNLFLTFIQWLMNLFFTPIFLVANFLPFFTLGTHIQSRVWFPGLISPIAIAPSSIVPRKHSKSHQIIRKKMTTLIFGSYGNGGP